MSAQEPVEPVEPLDSLPEPGGTSRERSERGSEGTDDVSTSSTSGHRPILRVVKGDLTAEELVALVAVVAARNAAAHGASRTAAPAPRSEWGHPARMIGAPHRIGPGQWRRSAWA